MLFNMRWLAPLQFIVFGASLAAALNPHVLPLVVRNPYLSLWLENARIDPWEQWPIFWHGSHIGLAIMAYVPSTGDMYPLLGRPQDALGHNRDHVKYPTYDGYTFDASTTNFTYTILDVHVTLSFSSPITPSDIRAQSIPASYINVVTEGSTDINVYLDINGQWLSNDRGSVIQWDYHSGDLLRSFSVEKKDQWLFTERHDRSEWGTLYFSAESDHSVSYQAGTSAELRNSFAEKGQLGNEIDSRFRGIMDQEPAFAFTKQFKLKRNASSSVKESSLFTIAYLHEPIAQFASERGLTQMRPFWSHYFSSAHDLLRFHYGYYDKAMAEAKEHSDKLTSHAKEIVSEGYADILALSARQVLGATVFAGTPDNPVLFMKEISSNGNFQTVDVIFPSSTFFLYTNPHWLAYLLEPLLEHQNAGLYPNAYSMHDLGAHFPNATGHPRGRDEKMPVEECGNMLIMGLAYAQAVIDQGAKEVDRNHGIKLARKWINKGGRYKIWKQWSEFLVEAGLMPDNQLSTDDFAGRLANQTNLAVKALVGIKAMSQLANIMGKDEDSKHYLDIAEEYMPKWEEFAVSRDKTHTKLAYHWYGSWGTLYNLYNDALLCFHHPSKSPTSLSFDKGKSDGYFPGRIYKLQSRWYSAVMQRYGLPLDVRHIYTKSDWEFYAAAIASKSTMHNIIDRVERWLSETSVNRPLTDLYDSESGNFPGISFMARPVIGGHFAVLALDQACAGEGLKQIRKIYDGDDEEAEYSARLDVQASLEDDLQASGSGKRIDELRLKGGRGKSHDRLQHQAVLGGRP